jgi:hypothetical protein
MALGTPLTRLFTLMLSNGATLKLPITGVRNPQPVSAATVRTISTDLGY